MAKSEGAQVRAEYDGPQINYDDFVDHHQAQLSKETSSASTMGEARAARKEFLDETNLNGKAVSAMRAGMKIKDDLKRLDWLRSMKALLPLAEQHITGNSSIDMFDGGSVSGGEVAEPDGETNNVTPLK